MFLDQPTSTPENLFPPKTKWTKEEDIKLAEVISIHGAKKWELISAFIHGRNGKQCRERWKSHISPSISKEEWSAEEIEKLKEYHRTFGNKWSKLTCYFPSRPPNAIKNMWNCILRRNMKNNSKNNQLIDQSRRHPIIERSIICKNDYEELFDTFDNIQCEN